MDRRNFLTLSSAALGVAALPASWARAQDGAGILRILSEGAANSFDSFSPGLNRNAIQVSWNIYDRLVRFAYKPRADGTGYYDYFDIRPELAERFEISADQKTLTFYLRKDATFHDGAPVTARDVKWSFDRILASPIGLAQFSTGSMTDPAQFVVVDAHTFRIDLPQPDRFALPNLALTYPIIVNSALAQQHATAEDPWAQTWLKTNDAGGGPYQIGRATPGQQILFRRFEAWRSGPLPGYREVLWDTVPAAETRLAALLRGRAQVVQDLPPKDVGALLANSSVQVIGVPTSAFQFIGMNSQQAPFDDLNVRKAIAYALPYQDMFQAALYGRGQPLFGPAPAPEDLSFPQPLGYETDPGKARAHLAASAWPDGFETTFSYELSVASVAEPVALLAQEALAKIGIRLTINKVPAGQLGTLLNEKKVPFYFEGSSAFLADPDYFFRVFYTGETRWNFGSYQSPEFAALVERSRYQTDPAHYAADVRRMIELAREEIPILLLWHPYLDTGLAKPVQGYSYTFHRQLDLRPLTPG